jgi:hypothetical protein
MKYESGHQGNSICISSVVLLATSGFSRPATVSVYFENVVIYDENVFCEHQPPLAAFTACLNNAAHGAGLQQNGHS